MSERRTNRTNTEVNWHKICSAVEDDATLKNNTADDSAWLRESELPPVGRHSRLCPPGELAEYAADWWTATGVGLRVEVESELDPDCNVR